MRTIAILAPPVDGLSPDKHERAQNAMLQQMMLLARGLPVTHPAVRAAAEIVGSAIAADPLEFALAGAEQCMQPVSAYRPPQPTAPEFPISRTISEIVASSPSLAPASPCVRLPASERDAAYARYLATICGSQPAARRTSDTPPE